MASDRVDLRNESPDSKTKREQFLKLSRNFLELDPVKGKTINLEESDFENCFLKINKGK